MILNGPSIKNNNVKIVPRGTSSARRWLASQPMRRLHQSAANAKDERQHETRVPPDAHAFTPPVADVIRKHDAIPLRVYSSRTQLVRVQAERFVQRVNLHLALGGSYAS